MSPTADGQPTTCLPSLSGSKEEHCRTESDRAVDAAAEQFAKLFYKQSILSKSVNRHLQKPVDLPDSSSSL
jgi:hypothetical protein